MSSSTLICFRFLYAIFVCFCFGVTLFHMLAECNRYENVFNYEVEMLVTMARFVEMCAIKLLSKFLFFCVARWWCGCVGAFSLHCLWCHCVNGFPWFSVPLLSPAFFCMSYALFVAVFGIFRCCRLLVLASLSCLFVVLWMLVFPIILWQLSQSKMELNLRFYEMGYSRAYNKQITNIIDLT